MRRGRARAGTRVGPLTTTVGLAVLVAAGLAGCGNPAPPEAEPTGTVVVPIQPTLGPISTAEPTVDPSAAGASGDFDASQDLTTSACTESGATWSYSGTMANPDVAERTFTVAIFLVRTSDLTPVVTKEIEVTVPPGGTAPVEAKDFHRAPADGLECVTGATVKEQ